MKNRLSNANVLLNFICVITLLSAYLSANGWYDFLIPSGIGLWHLIKFRNAG